MFKIRKHRNGKISIKERYGRPAVYLDNWALNDIALENHYRNRFIKAMRRRNGTLRVSVQNIDELNKQGDWGQITSILKMIDSVDSGFLNVNVTEVIEREDKIIKNPFIKHNDPSGDVDLIKSRLQSRSLPLDPNISEIISIAILGTPVKRYKDVAFADLQKRKLDLGRSAQKIAKRAKERFHKAKQGGKKYDAATRELNSMAYDFIIINETMGMSKSSEWYDLNHVIVPVAYCDIVLVDKKWKAFVKQTGFEFPDIAMIFDKKSLDEFFVQLETNSFSQVNKPWKNKIK